MDNSKQSRLPLYTILTPQSDITPVPTTRPLDSLSNHQKQPYWQTEAIYHRVGYSNSQYSLQLERLCTPLHLRFQFSVNTLHLPKRSFRFPYRRIHSGPQILFLHLFFRVRFFHRATSLFQSLLNPQYSLSLSLFFFFLVHPLSRLFSSRTVLRPVLF